MSIKVYQSWCANYLHDLLVKDVCRFRNGFAVVHCRCPLLSYFGRSSWFLSPASLIWLAQSRFETRLRHYESILFTSLSRTLSTKHFISSTKTRHPSILFWFLYLHLVSDSTPDEGGLNILLHRKYRWQKAADGQSVSCEHLALFCQIKCYILDDNGFPPSFLRVIFRGCFFGNPLHCP